MGTVRSVGPVASLRALRAAAGVATRRVRPPSRAAAVAPGASLHGSSHAQDAGVEVDVPPRFATRGRTG
jgi:hypothetical protein